MYLEIYIKKEWKIFIKQHFHNKISLITVSSMVILNLILDISYFNVNISNDVSITIM